MALSTAGTPRAAPLRLLVVDDDELDRLALRRCMQQSGMALAADEATSGAEALRLTDGGAYDCILLDYYLPGEDGIALIAELRRAAPDTPVVIFTGRGDEDIAVELMKFGAADYLPKASLTGERLAASVRHALEVSRAAVAQRRAEEELRVEAARFRTLANAIPQLTWMADVAGSPYWFNQRWFDYTGDTAEMSGDWRRFHHPDHIGRIERGLRTIAETGMPWEDTHPLRGRDGTDRWFLSRALPVRGTGGEISGILGTCTDITDRIRAEEMRVQSQKLAGVRMLAGGVAHEINNAMTVVLGFSQFLLTDSRLAEERRDEIGQIQRAADRAARIARQLLTYSRQVASNPRAIELDAVLGDMAPMIQRLLGPDCRLVTTGSCTERIRLDVNHLEQILTILILNARDAMPIGGTLTLSTDAVVLGTGVRDAVTGSPVAPGRYGQLAVRDSGIGMDTETVSHIFEPFFTTKPVGLGTGLGLPVLGGLLEESGGHVTVASEPGAGTTFTLYLPLVPGNVVEPDEPRAGEADGRDLAGATVLVVDDEPAVREVAARTLQERGCRVLQAADGLAALELINRHGPPDLVLADLLMKGMGGVELAGRLQSRWPELPVLFVSGHPEMQLCGPGVLAGVDTVVQKPFTADDLIRSVYEALAWRGGTPEPG